MLKGKIYYTVSNKFREIDLATRKRREVYKGPDLHILGGIDAIDNNLFIIRRNGIEYYDLQNNTFKFIVGRGDSPLYIKEINSIFFYKYMKGLFLKNLDKDTPEELITERIGGFFHVKVSPSEIVYYNTDKKIEFYNFLNKTFRTLHITGYEPWASYPKKNSLICRNQEDKSFYFVNISTLEKEKIEIDKPNLIKWCIVPVEDYDCLVYSKIRVVLMAEYEDMYIYWVDEKKEQKYLKDVFIHFGTYVKD